MSNNFLKTEVRRLDEFRVEILYQNLCSKSIGVLRWNTGLQSSRCNALIIFDRDGNEVTYIGSRFRHIFSKSNSLKVFAPGENVTITINVPQLYNVTNNTDYKIEARPPKSIRTMQSLNDVKSLDEMHASDEVLSADSIGLKAKFSGIERIWDNTYLYEPENIKSLSISADRCPIGLCVFPGRNIGVAACKPPGISGAWLVTLPICSDSFSAYHKKKIAQLTTAISYSSGRIYRGHVSVENNSVFRRWFGNYTDQKARIVQDVVNRSQPHEVCKTAFYTPGSYGPDVDTDTLASARFYPGSKTFGLTLYPRFWSLPFSGFNSQIETLIHEYSHGYAGTQDHVYGITECEKLAKNDPHLTIENADSISYFVSQQYGTVTPPPIRFAK